jgi:hypothetical protein
VNAAVPGAVGEPLMAPVAASIDSPAGSAPAVIDRTRGKSRGQDAQLAGADCYGQ